MGVALVAGLKSVMVRANQDRNRDRITSAIAVAFFHALLGYALINGLGFEIAGEVSDTLKVFDVPEPPPPPVEEAAPTAARTKALEGAASPPNLKAQPSPVVAPLPKVRLDVPPPIVASPAPGPGSDSSAGASDRVGPGLGAGGDGTGTGSGSQGSGTGGGGIATRPRWISGGLVNSDYPRAASKAGVRGTVVVRLAVGADGRVRGCTVTRTSGNAELDATTCRLIEQRFRYAPATDARGRFVADVMGWKQDWWFE